MMTANGVFWASSPDSVIADLQSSSQNGLGADQALERLRETGPNILKQQKRVPAWRRFLSQFASVVVLALLGATIISAALGEYVDAIAIAAIVIVNAIIGFMQEAKAEAAVEALRKLAAPKSRVLRDGAVTEIEGQRIVPGDILVLEAGDYVPADARLLTVSQLSADEAPLTGESLPVAKNTGIVQASAPLAERQNMVFAGTAISSGSARAVVTATGMQTEIGRIAGLLADTEVTQTPLQARLEEVGSKLLILSLAIVGIVALLGFYHGYKWLDIVLTAISLAVAAIPEGLPAVVTLSLALSIRRMVKRNAIVRHLPAVETLGSTDVICTDKTGTLTTGKMRVREVVLADGTVAAADNLVHSDLLVDLVESAVLCSNATLAVDGSSTGDPTEVALLFLARDNNTQATPKTRLFEWSFDSNRKRMSVAVAEGERTIIHTKGAPEAMLPLCRWEGISQLAIEKVLAELSAQGRRMLAIARRELPVTSGAFAQSEYARAGDAAVESELTFVGLVAIADPPRAESIEAIKQCKAAGVRVVMITGDHPITAKAIAAEMGIIEPGIFENVLTGAELDNLDAAALKNQIEKIAVYARVTPEHKLKIVEAWKANGNVVAMTGDGVNDAPALKAASIGVAMGKGGTEVARQASSMVLADDNFATIVGAIEEGRAIYGNIRRTVKYLLTGNLTEILVMLGAGVLGWGAPLTPIHLLWINLVTDGLPSLALAAEPVSRDILATSNKPSPKNFFDRQLYTEMTWVGVLAAIMALIVYGYSLKYEGEQTARTHVFTFLVFEELFRSFACRSDLKTFLQMGLFSNAYLLLAVAIPISFQFLLHHTSWFLELFKVHKLEWAECIGLLALTLIPTVILELRKWLRSRMAKATYNITEAK